MDKADLIEIFSSIQGEGNYVGCRQVFVRFAGCNLHCNYCDTNFNEQEFCDFEISAGTMKFRQIRNPVTAEEVVGAVNALISEVSTHSISFTGGEPLLQFKFIENVIKRLMVAHSHCPKFFLETNGVLYKNLSKIIDLLDIISMDIKLPSVTNADFFDLHRKFIEIAKSKDLYIKIVVTNETTIEEFIAAVEMIASISRNISLILQPVTPVRKVQPIIPHNLLCFQKWALDYLDNVRVIPQTHKIINLL